MLGNFLEINRSPFMEPHKKWWKDANHAPALSYTIMFWRPSVIPLDKALVQSVLTAPYGKQPFKYKKIKRLLSDVLGDDGLVTLEGENWIRHRRMLQPSFNTSVLRDSLNQCIPNKVNRFIGHWEKAATHQREINVFSHLSSLTLDVIGDVAFSHDFHGLDMMQEWADKLNNSTVTDDGAESEQLAHISDPFLQGLEKSLKFDLFTIGLSLVGLANFNRYINPRVRRNRSQLDEAVDAVVADARRDTTKAKSLLHLMLQAKDDHVDTKKRKSIYLSDTELRDEVKTFMIAGHETTSTWLYWCLYALSKYPDVQERVYQDIIQHAPPHSSGEKSGVEHIMLNHVEKMDFMNAFLQEVLRLYPPVGLIPRQAAQEITAKAEDGTTIAIPRGTRVTIPIHLMHRHPKYWDNPEEFQPERWLNVSDAEWDRRRFVFVPFSAGGRNCIGQKFATQEAQLILAPILRAYRVLLAPSQRDVEHEFTSRVTMRSKPSLKIVIHKR